MNVVAHQPRAWFLLEHDGALYLDVNCSHSAVSFPMLLCLTEPEARRYREGGTDFLSAFAAEVQERALSVYRARIIAAQLGTSVDEVVTRWMASNTPGAE